MGKIYSVLIIDMSYSEEKDFVIEGFPTLELAKEFARRWVRDSVEELREPSQTREQLRDRWFTYGEDAVVLGNDYSGFSELDYFIDHPATPEERDWQSIKKEAGSRRLSSENPNIRWSAAQELTQHYLDNKEYKKVTELMKHDDVDVRKGTAEAFWRAILADRPSYEEILQRKVFDLLFDVADPSVSWKALMSEASSVLIPKIADASVSLQAADVLVKLVKQFPEDFKELASKLIELIGHKDAYVRRNSAYVLLSVASKFPEEFIAAVPKLIGLLDDKGEEYLRGHAAYALENIASKFPENVRPAIPRLIALLNESEPHAKQAASHALGKLVGVFPDDIRSGIPNVRANLLDKDSNIRLNATYIIANLVKKFPDDLRVAIPKLMVQLDDENEYVRDNAVAILRKFPNFVQDAIALLDDKDDSVRAEAAWALAQRAKKFPEEVRGAIPKLIGLLDDGYKDTRINAAFIFAHRAEEAHDDIRKAIPKLISLLDDKDKRIRYGAAIALTAIAVKFPDHFKEGITALMSLTYDENEDVRNAASKAIEEIAKRFPDAAKAISSAPEKTQGIRVDGFGGMVFEVPNAKAVYELPPGELWMKSIADRIAKEIPSVRGYPLTAEPGAGPVFFVTLKGAEGDATAARQLREKMHPIIREELDKESKKCTYGVTSINKGDDLLFWCTVVLPPLGEG